MKNRCRHILESGRRCAQPAVHNSVYCRHHQTVKLSFAQPAVRAAQAPLPLVFPGDSAAIEHNRALVAQALKRGRIDKAKAAAFTRIFRSCEIVSRNNPRSGLSLLQPAGGNG